MSISLNTAQRFVMTVIEEKGAPDPGDGKPAISTSVIRREYEVRYPGKNARIDVDRCIRALIAKGCVSRMSTGSRYIVGTVKAVMSIKEIEG